MGKRLISQRAGKGSIFRVPDHYAIADVKFRSYDEKEKKDVVRGVVKNLINDRVRTSVLMEVEVEDGGRIFLIAPEGSAINDEIEFGVGAKIKIGNVIPLKKIPDGTPVYNIEGEPGDGGKFIRTAGAVGYVVSHINGKVVVSLSSKKTKIFDENCRAQIGVVSCGGRIEKPILKAGRAEKIYKLRYWPVVRGVAMSAYDHPHGGKEHHAGKGTMVSRHAPPGAKVGLIAARRAGRKKR
ncbi:MAG: 50S ribosomal protein L2 [Candidatus Micrarchaeia archaeon]